MTSVTCPVCQRADPVGAHCPGCGWLLSAGPWVGAPTAARVRSFETAFAAACRTWDLAAAAVAAGYPDAGDPVRFGRMVERARGPEPEQSDLRAAVDAAAGRRQELGTVGDAIGPALLTGATIIDIGPGGITEAELEPDDLGRPRLTDLVHHTWQSLGLPADDDQARLALATGSATVEPDWPADAIVLNRLAGWRTADAMVADRPNTHRVRGNEPAVDHDLVHDLALALPQRHACGLVLIDVAADGRTSTVTHPLFPRGATALDSQEAVVRIGAPSQSTSVLIAVVAGPPGTPPWRCAPISTSSCELTPDRQHVVRVRLTGPCQVEIVEPRTEPDQWAVDTWPASLERVPPRYRRHDHAVDLVVAIELGRNGFRTRQELTLDLFDSIEREHPDPATVRIAVLGYSDHKGRDPQQVLTVQEFGPLNLAREFVDGLHGTPVVEQWAAPVEDALWAAASLPWRPVPRTLVLLGSRPPHPTDLGRGRAPSCPNRHRWNDLLTSLDRDEVHRVAVWDQPPWWTPHDEPSGQASATWAALSSPRTPLRADWATADRLAAEARVLGRAGPATTMPFPLTRVAQDR
ncbi:hypothetical protein [Actinokineospora diospyrosa]|uniref:VWFA domain-containing protein n=1 Tax=Actinokineospora diospyrosa TaxID=103728 RepID=A0ABT1IKW6_9PSEU|nr:hypothetical protein [Actinokineospora diospyrosa]MCP2273294.1 hypothetical protein [Actinokineospora diospyrosa]